MGQSTRLAYAGDLGPVPTQRLSFFAGTTSRSAPSPVCRPAATGVLLDRLKAGAGVASDASPGLRLTLAMFILPS